MALIKKAARENVKVKVLLMSPSGGGKTYTSLRLAKGMGGKTLFIGTEARRGLYYADEFDYDYVELKEVRRNDPDYNEYKSLLPKISEPYAPENYIALVRYAVDNGYDNLIIDSTTHEWSSKGGILDAKNKMPGTNDYIKWAKLTPRHDNFIYEILHSPINVIATVRGKDAYVMEENSKGKQAPKKVGLGAVQRDGMEYEYTVTFLIDQETHVATVMKDNTHLFEGRYDMLTEQDGEDLVKWANSGNTTSKNIETYKKEQEEKQQLKELINKIDVLAKEKAKLVGKEDVFSAIKKHNNNSANYKTVKSLEVAKKIHKELQGLEAGETNEIKQE